jgi:hypothetical protein
LGTHCCAEADDATSSAAATNVNVLIMVIRSIAGGMLPNRDATNISGN